MKFILSILILVAPLTSWGVKWIERGNGGFSIRCAGKATEVLDINELRTRYMLTLDTQHASSVEERVEYLLSKIEVVNPTRAKQYRNWAATFSSESRFISNLQMYPVPDLGFAVKPKDCIFELSAFQREPDVLSTYRYAISQDIWNELDVINKASLILHEIIYRELIQEIDFSGTSESARFLNAKLNSTDFEKLNSSQYVTLLQSLGFRNADFGGYSILLRSFDPGWNYKLGYFPDGSIKSAALDPNLKVFPENLEMKTAGCYEMDSVVSFNNDGSTDSLFLTYMERGGCIPSYEYSDGKSRISFSGNSWAFYPNGKLKSIRGYTKGAGGLNSVFMVLQEVPFVRSSSVPSIFAANAEFNEQGVLSALSFDRFPSCLEKSKNRVRVLSAGGFKDMDWSINMGSFEQQLNAMALCR